MWYLEFSTLDRSGITVFKPSESGETPCRIWNQQYIAYAGYEQPDGSVLGDPINADFTKICLKLGNWRVVMEMYKMTNRSLHNAVNHSNRLEEQENISWYPSAGAAVWTRKPKVLWHSWWRCHESQHTTQQVCLTLKRLILQFWPVTDTKSYPCNVQISRPGQAEPAVVRSTRSVWYVHGLRRTYLSCCRVQWLVHVYWDHEGPVWYWQIQHAQGATIAPDLYNTSGGGVVLSM